MSVIYYRKALGVGPYETVADYFADLDPEGNFMNYIQTCKDNGTCYTFETKLSATKNAVYMKGSLPNDSDWTTILANEAAAGFNFKQQLNVITITAAEYDAGA